MQMIKNHRMARLGALVFAFSLTLLIAADGPWIPLFNGKDLTGWTGVNGVTAEVVDGNLQVGKGMGWLRTEKEYKDFILELEFRPLEEQYDSGIYIRSGLEGKPWPQDGWQINLRYNMLGGLVKNNKTMVPAESPKLPVNQWHKLRLEVRGKKAKLILNGEDNWETDLVDDVKGYLGIQIENKKFDFRNIRLQAL